MRKFIEKLVEGGFLISGSVSSFTILLIIVFLFKEAAGLFNSPEVEEGYILAVNQENPVEHLSPEQIMDVFDANITISGITSAVVLGIGRAIGETMAVLMVTGNAAVIPTSFFEPVRTIPATIAAELGEAPAGGAHYQALFMLGAVLFLITLGLSIAVEYISSKRKI